MQTTNQEKCAVVKASIFYAENESQDTQERAALKSAAIRMAKGCDGCMKDVKNAKW